MNLESTACIYKRIHFTSIGRKHVYLRKYRCYKKKGTTNTEFTIVRQVPSVTDILYLPLPIPLSL